MSEYFELSRLLGLLSEHRDDGLKYDPETSILSSPGCSGEHSCCAVKVDLDEVAAELEELGIYPIESQQKPCQSSNAMGTVPVVETSPGNFQVGRPSPLKANFLASHEVAKEPEEYCEVCGANWSIGVMCDREVHEAED